MNEEATGLATDVAINAATGGTGSIVSGIAQGLGAITSSVFGWLSNKQTTKQKELEIQSLEQQKALLEAQGEIEQTKLLAAKIDVEKQALLTAQKEAAGTNYTKVAIVGGVLLLAGFVVYMVFRTPKQPKESKSIPKVEPLKA